MTVFAKITVIYLYQTSQPIRLEKIKEYEISLILWGDMTEKRKIHSQRDFLWGDTGGKWKSTW